MYPTAAGFYDGTDGRRERFTVDEWAGIDSFPFPSTELSLLAVSDRLVDLAQVLLEDGDLRIYSAEAWAKYTGAADYDQALHRDYLNRMAATPARPARASPPTPLPGVGVGVGGFTSKHFATGKQMTSMALLIYIARKVYPLTGIYR